MIAPSLWAVQPRPLDDYHANLWSCISVDKLLSDFYGTGTVTTESGAFDYIDSTTSTLYPAGFDFNAVVNTASMASRLSGHNAALNTFNNQQPNAVSAHGFVAPSAANRPAVATAGAFLGTVQFDGSNDFIQTSANSGTPTAFTVYMRLKERSIPGDMSIIEQSGNYNASNACIAYWDGTLSKLSVGVHTTAPGYSRSDFTLATALTTEQVLCFRFDRSQVTSAAMTVLFVNGVKQTRTGNGDSGTLPSGTFGAALWYLGARFGFPPMNLHTCLIYETAHSDALVATISGIIAALP